MRLLLLELLGAGISLGFLMFLALKVKQKFHNWIAMGKDKKLNRKGIRQILVSSRPFKVRKVIESIWKDYTNEEILEAFKELEKVK